MTERGAFPSIDPPPIAGEAERAEKDRRVRAFLDEHGLEGVLLGTIANFAWTTGGRSNRVGAATEVGPAALLLTRQGRFLVTDEVEKPRRLDLVRDQESSLAREEQRRRADLRRSADPVRAAARGPGEVGDGAQEDALQTVLIKESANASVFLRSLRLASDRGRVDGGERPTLRHASVRDDARAVFRC